MSVPKIPPPVTFVRTIAARTDLPRRTDISLGGRILSRKNGNTGKKTLVISRNLFKIAKNDEKMTNNNH